MRAKMMSVGGLALILVAVLAGWTDRAPEGGEPRLISVTGNADVRIVPDEVVLTLGVETWDKDLTIAKGENDVVVSRVLNLAQEMGIPQSQIQTDYLGIEPRYHNGTYDPSDFIGYFVHKSVVLTLRDLTKFEDLLSRALRAGVNYVQGIEFRTTELRKHRDAARALAVKAAREKAEALAAELGQRVGPPRTVQEQQSSWWSGYSAWWGGRWGSAMAQNVVQELDGAPLSLDGSIAPGQISVTASVAITFELME